jgi:hypothetical protein
MDKAHDFSEYIEFMVKSCEGAGRVFSMAKKTMAVLLRDEFVCRYCGEITVDCVADHVVPIASGGTDDMGNLVCSCYDCNASKGAKDVGEWMEAGGKSQTNFSDSYAATQRWRQKRKLPNVAERMRHYEMLDERKEAA